MQLVTRDKLISRTTFARLPMGAAFNFASSPSDAIMTKDSDNSFRGSAGESVVVADASLEVIRRPFVGRGSDGTNPCGEGGTIQDMQVAWTPANLQLGEKIGMFCYNNSNTLVGIETLTFKQEIFEEGIDLENLQDVQSILYQNAVSLTLPGKLYITGALLQLVSFPLLEDVSTYFGIDIEFSTTLGGDLYCPVLTTINGGVNIATQNAATPSSGVLTVTLPLLQSISGNAGLYYMQSISLPELVNVGGSFDCSTSDALALVALPKFLPTNGNTLNFSGCALVAESINHILARCVANSGYVAGNVLLSGGTNSAPTGQGAIDKATLIGRGVTVTTN